MVPVKATAVVPARSFADPQLLAVTGCAPTARPLVANDALPFEIATVDSNVPLSKKLTVPVVIVPVAGPTRFTDTFNVTRLGMRRRIRRRRQFDRRGCWVDLLYQWGCCTDR